MKPFNICTPLKTTSLINVQTLKVENLVIFSKISTYSVQLIYECCSSEGIVHFPVVEAI